MGSGGGCDEGLVRCSGKFWQGKAGNIKSMKRNKKHFSHLKKGNKLKAG